MGLLHLVPLLAFLPKILLQGLPTAPPPPPPTISVTPEKTEYLIGDTVSIRCAAPSAPSAPSKLQGFQLARTGSWLEVRSPWRSHTFTFNLTGPRDGGPHACTYTVLDRYRRPTRSRESRVVDIKVRDPPPAPTLVLNASSRVVSEGSPLLFLCTAPAGAVGPRFRIFRDGSEIPGEILGGHQIRLLVAPSGRNHSGNFSCGYEELVQGRWILSALSDVIEVTVKEPPGAPRLDVDPPFTELLEGAPLRLTCLAPGAAPGLRFHFFRNGVEIPRSPPEPKNPQNPPNLPGITAGGSSELLIPKTPQNFGGIFSCGFEEDVGGTWVASPPSQGLEVVVKALPGPPGLLLDPPSGRVRAGDVLGVTCAANGSGGGGERRFYFYKDGAQQFWEAGFRERALLNLPVAENSGGGFSCRYEERVRGRWVASPLSRVAVVTVTAPALPVPLVAGCAAAAAAALLGLLGVVCYCHRRRGRAHWKGLYNKEDPGTYPMTGVDRSEA